DGPASSPEECICLRRQLPSKCWSLEKSLRTCEQICLRARGSRQNWPIPRIELHMARPLYSSLYQINTRVWLTALSRKLGRNATLDDIQDVDLDRIAKFGFDWVWLLSVWQTGEVGKQISRTIPELRKEFEETLPDLTDEDIQ